MSKAQCKGKTTSRAPCKMPALKGGRYCFNHAPEAAADRAQARKRGGQARHTPHAGDPASIPPQLATIQDAGMILNYTLAELLAMDNSIPRARALLALFDSFVRAFEIGELEKRVQALEEKRK